MGNIRTGVMGYASRRYLLEKVTPMEEIIRFVMHRGDCQELIFLDDEDRQHFLATLADPLPNRLARACLCLLAKPENQI